MRTHHHKVFDEYVPAGTDYDTAVFSHEQAIAQMGHADQIAIHAVVDNLVEDDGHLNVQIEHSGDGRNWIAKNGDTSGSSGTGEVKVPMTGSLKKNATNQGWGSDPNKDSNNQPLLTYVRLRIWFTGGSKKAGHVKIHVTHRDQGR